MIVGVHWHGSAHALVWTCCGALERILFAYVDRDSMIRSGNRTEDILGCLGLGGTSIHFDGLSPHTGNAGTQRIRSTINFVTKSLLRLTVRVRQLDILCGW